MKKLTKCTSNKMICGVCSGVAKYFDVDPTIIRLLWTLFALCGGTGVIAYIICAIIMPEESTSLM